MGEVMGAVTHASFYQHELAKLIEAEIEILKQNLSSGSSQSFEEYKYQVGRIAGLRAAIDLMSDAEKICNRH